jgi:dolichyl-phosphate-mannose-protein mannosyltransferase
MSHFLHARSAILGALLVAVIAAAVFLPRLGAPQAAIWDESYYLTAIQRQVEHRAQFASHPPLGFLLMAAGARLAGDDGRYARNLGFDKKVAGEDVPAAYDYRRARIVSATAGVLGCVAFYGLMLILTGRVSYALLLSNLFTFENAFVVQFRAAQLDGLLTLFVVLALAALTAALKRPNRTPGLELAFGVAVGLATMIKLAGVCLAFGGLVLLARRVGTFKRGAIMPIVGTSAASGLTMAVGFAAVVAAVFAWQAIDGFRPPDPDTTAGRRDSAFVSPANADYLAGRSHLDIAVVAATARDDFTYMVADMEGMPNVDPNGSAPIAWPLMQQPIVYRWDRHADESRYIALIGNPVGWTLGLCGLAAGLWTALASLCAKRRSLAWGLLALWAAILAFHIGLSWTRVMYLYHYFPGLIVSWSLLANGVTDTPRMRSLNRLSRFGPPALCSLHLVAFVFVSPFSFHTPQKGLECEWRSLGTVRCSP